MSSVEDALVYWNHHEGSELAEQGASAEDLIKDAFRAGWKLAGGDQRLEALDQLAGMVDGCCDEQAGKQFCESHGCKTLNDLRRTLGDPDLEDEGEA